VSPPNWQDTNPKSNPFLLHFLAFNLALLYYRKTQLIVLSYNLIAG
jgi:hypothetical protein